MVAGGWRPFGSQVGDVDPALLFAHRLLVAIRSPAPVTRALSGLCVAVFALVFVMPWLTGVPASEAELTRQTWTIALGAKVNALVEAGQVWRLLSALFLHGGGLHLMLNLMALTFLGRVYEGVFGAARFLAVYLGSGLVASLASWAWSDAPSVGASGAIFGILGGVAVFGLRHRHRMIPPLKKAFLVNPLIWIVLNVLGGALIPQVDQAAHVGGLVAGSLLTVFLADRVECRLPRPLGTRLARAWAGLLAVLTGISVLVGASQVVSGVRYPDLSWRVTLDQGARVIVPVGWVEGLPNGVPCPPPDPPIRRAVCRSGPLGERFLALLLEHPEGLAPDEGRQEHEGLVILARSQGERAYMLSFPRPLEPVLARQWKRFPHE